MFTRVERSKVVKLMIILLEKHNLGNVKYLIKATEAVITENITTTFHGQVINTKTDYTRQV